MVNITKYYSPFQIGQCCSDQIVNPGNPSGDLSGKNELVSFINQATATIQWNASRIGRFGTIGVFYVETQGFDGKYRKMSCEIIPNAVPNPTFYSIDFGGLGNYRVTIT